MNENADVAVIGLGHGDRADDATGLALAAEVARRELPGVEVIRGPRDAAWILDAWRGRSGVVVLDCIRSGRPVGTLHRVDPHDGPFVDGAAASTHGLGLASAVELGRALGDLPARLVVIGIEGGSFEIGGVMSPEVRAALPGAVARVETVLSHWRSGAQEERRRA